MNNILDEYVRITNIIDNIRKKLEEYKIYIENKIKRAKTEKMRKKYLKASKLDIRNIKNTPEISEKYKALINKQHALKKILIPYNEDINFIQTENDNINDNISKIIYELKLKYAKEESFHITSSDLIIP